MGTRLFVSSSSSTRAFIGSVSEINLSINYAHQTFAVSLKFQPALEKLQNSCNSSTDIKQKTLINKKKMVTGN